MPKRKDTPPTLAELVAAIIKYRHKIFIPENDPVGAPELVNWTQKAQAALKEQK